MKVQVRSGYSLEYEGRRRQAGTWFEADEEWVEAHRGRLAFEVAEEEVPKDTQDEEADAAARDDLEAKGRPELAEMYEAAGLGSAKGVGRPKLLEALRAAQRDAA